MMDNLLAKINFLQHSNLLRPMATLIALCTCIYVNGQGKWGLRVNQNTDVFSVTYKEDFSSYEKTEIRISRISAAVDYMRGKYTHDLEFFIPQINASTLQYPWPQTLYESTRFKNRISSYSLRYTVARNVYSLTKSFFLVLGGALNPYYVKTEGLPQTELSYYASRSVLGISFNVVPGVSLKISKRISFVLDCPIKVFDVYRLIYEVRNPSLPISMQKMKSAEVDFFMNAFTLRLGAMYRLGN